MFKELVLEMVNVVFILIFFSMCTWLMSVESEGLTQDKTKTKIKALMI